MIAVFSTQNMEETTVKVIEWIEYLGGEYVRLNGQELENEAYALQLPKSDARSFLRHDGRDIPLDEIRSIWYRRTSPPHLPNLAGIPEPGLRVSIANHLLGESKAVKNSLYRLLDYAHWLSHTDTSTPNKTQMLIEADRLGMATPRTLITNDKESLRRFHEEVGEMIIKCAGDTQHFLRNGLSFNHFTELFGAEDIEALPQKFFPILVQECIEKVFEIRTFYFFGEFYSMAIFSQEDDQTKTDFRIYNYGKIARNVPYRLPAETAAQLTELMKIFNLDTGAVDFIKARDGRLYFLEINPVGQFGMVSYPCNYQLEKRVAQHLIDKDRQP